MKEKLFEALSEEALEKVTGGGRGDTPADGLTFTPYGEPREGYYYAERKPGTVFITGSYPDYSYPAFKTAQITSVRDGTVQYRIGLFTADARYWSASLRISEKTFTDSFKQKYPYEMNVHD